MTDDAIPAATLVVGGLYRSLGQEACSVGSAYALERGDIPHPMDQATVTSSQAEALEK